MIYIKLQLCKIELNRWFAPRFESNYNEYVELKY